MEINSRGELRSHSLTPVSVGSSPPRPCTLWVDRPTPALPAALSLLLPVTGPGERGGGKSHSHLAQPDQRGLRWGGAWGGSCVPPHQWQDGSASDDILSAGDNLFCTWKRRAPLLYLHIKTQFISSFNEAGRTIVIALCLVVAWEHSGSYVFKK